MTTTSTDFAARLAATIGRMPSGHVRVLAAAVAAAPCYSPGGAAAALGALPHPVYRQHAEQLVECWSELPGLGGESFGLALLSALAMRDAERESETVEAVATGPSTPHVSLRHTRAVLLDLISHASEQLLLVSFAAYKVPDLVQAVAEAVGRGVSVRMVLEAAEESSGALTHDAAKAFAALGGAVEFYIWPQDRRPAGVSATLHAKAVVADGRAAFISSANLTGSALDHNLELGVLVRGGPVPRRLADHFSSLMAARVLRRVE
jgi:phosphatidylserine/phosphatidylglycerophosphate/cardiolipin synthase-like enzyme